MDLATGCVNELERQVSRGRSGDPANLCSYPQRGFVLLTTSYRMVSTDYRNHENKLTTDFWVGRLLHLRQHLLECTDRSVVVTGFVQRHMFPLVAPWRRQIELDHLMMRQWD